MSPITFGKICSAFMRSPHAQTASGASTAPNGISKQYDPAIRQHDAAAEDVLEELLAVVSPARQRRVAEQQHAERDDPAADGRHGGVERGGDRGRAREKCAAGLRARRSTARPRRSRKIVSAR